jgi:hypothetical protein
MIEIKDMQSNACRKTIIVLLLFLIAASRAAWATFPNWIGVYGSYQRQSGGNPGAFTILMNQDYYGLGANVGIQVNGGSWVEYPMTYSTDVSGNSAWTYTPSFVFPANATVNYYFHGFDSSGDNIYDNNGGGNYSFQAAAPIISSVAGNMDIQGDLISFGGLYNAPLSPGLIVTYGESGSGSILSFVTGQPTGTWLWRNAPSSGTNPVTSMELDSSNRLSLTGTGASRGSILIDPNAGQITINNSAVLTTNDQYVAFGHASIASGYDATAIGVNATAQGVEATAFGYQSVAANYSAAIGPDATASGGSSVSLGPISTAYGVFSAAAGYEADAYGSFSTALGPNSYANNSAASLGYYADAGGSGSLALGYAAESPGQYSTAIGYNAFAQSYGEVAVGQYNVPQGSGTSWVSTDDLFVIGNGSSWVPSDAIEVLKNGNTSVSGTFTASVVTVSGTMANGVVVSTGSNLILVPQQGDLSMGTFTNGVQPPTVP